MTTAGSGIEIEPGEPYLVRRVLGWMSQGNAVILRLEAVRADWNAGPIRPLVVTAESPDEQLANTNTPNRPTLAWRPSWKTETMELALSFSGPRTLRMILGEAGERDFGMLVQPNPPKMPLDVASEEDSLLLKGEELSVLVRFDPFDLVVRRADGTVVARLPMEDLDVHGLLHSPPLAIRRKDGRDETLFSLALEAGERLYGLGEQFGRLDKVGSRVVLWSADAWGTTTNGAYKPIPFMLSSRGYGLFLHTPARVIAELGTRSLSSYTMVVEEPVLDLFLFAGPGFKQILADYTELTGRASVPPDWAFGLWMSRCRYKTRSEVEGVADRLRAEGIPADVLHIDPAWLQVNSLNCDFEWNHEVFPDPEGMLRRLKAQGFKLSLWELPYLAEGTPSYAEAVSKGFLVKDGEGNPIQPDAIQGVDGRPRGILDFTHPEARRWWQDKHRPLLRMGVSVFKTDFGEGVPEGSHFADGGDGVTRHNIFPLLYNRAVADVTAEETGRAGLVWGRSAWAGSQRYPGQWGGDPQTSVEAMAATLRGGLSYALSAPGIWSHDIGGFYGSPPSPALYIRWAQFGLLSPLARAHGTTLREPWEFGPEALEIFREFAQLRYRLLPYLLHSAREAAVHGLPMLRPLLLEFPDDPGVGTVDDQYLLGSSLLVAPVFSDSEQPVTRSLYLPSGGWYDWWTGEPLEGGRYLKEQVPLNRVPLYMRAGSALPLGAPSAWIADRVDPESITLFPPLGGASTVDLLIEGGSDSLNAPLHKSDTVGRGLVPRRPGLGDPIPEPTFGVTKVSQYKTERDLEVELVGLPVAVSSLSVRGLPSDSQAFVDGRRVSTSWDGKALSLALEHGGEVKLQLRW